MIQRAIFLAALFFSGASALWAQDVTLTSEDGSVRLSGELIDFDGEFYRIQSQYGPVTVESTGLICDGAACPDLDSFVEEFTFSGAPNMGRVLLPALIESYAARNGFVVRRVAQDENQVLYELSGRRSGEPVARMTLRLTSSAESFADLIAEEADVALSLREITAAEVAVARTASLGDLTAPGRARILALDALVPLVAVSNPTAVIDLGDLAAVFAGGITDWADLGGEAAPIALHLRDPSSGVTEAFRARVLGAYDLATLAPGITYHPSDRAVADAVADDPFAIGIGSFSEMGDASPLAIAGPCGFASAADITAIKTEDYPLTAPLFAYLPPRRLPRIARQFLRYVGSPAAQPVIRRAGFVDQFPAGIALEQQGVRFANAIDRAGDEIDLSELQRLVRTLAGHSRLTVTFRFEGGSTALDAQSRSNVALLSEAVKRGVFDGRELLFVGFSDGQGPAVINRRISNTRARAVRDAVQTAARSVDPDRLTLRIDAFGEALPMGCDDVAWGRSVNRRVEVWLK